MKQSSLMILIQVFVVLWLFSGWLASFSEIKKINALKIVAWTWCILGAVPQLTIYFWILWRFFKGTLWQGTSWKMLATLTSIYLIPFIFFASGWFYYHGMKTKNQSEKKVAGWIGFVLLVLIIISISFSFKSFCASLSQ